MYPAKICSACCYQAVLGQMAEKLYRNDRFIAFCVVNINLWVRLLQKNHVSVILLKFVLHVANQSTALMAIVECALVSVSWIIVHQV